MQYNNQTDVEEGEEYDEIKELEDRGFKVNHDTGKIEGFNANIFATHIKSRLKIKYLADGYFYTYASGVWSKKEDNLILRMLRNVLQEPRFGTWNRKKEDEYVTALKREVYYSKEMNPHRYLINMKNGMYNIDKFEFLPHEPKYLSTIQIPVEYVENTECLMFLKYINEVFENDKEKISVAQEWFGYSMTSETKAQKALILYGSGGNGKGVFTDILGMLIGEENISTIPLNELNKGFSRVCIYNKTANICNENETDSKTFNTQYFKAIVGEDMINAEQKGKPVFSFKPTVKFILSMNSLPSTKDKSNGYYRRLMILNFNAYFDETKRDMDLKGKLRKELPGIFLWAMEGLKRLRDNNYKFSKCKDMDETIKKYEIEQNPMLEFFDDCLEQVNSQGYREDNKVIYNSFRHWAYKNGHRGWATISSQRFWKEFDGIAVSKGYVYKAGRSDSLRYHTGVRVKKGYRASEYN